MLSLSPATLALLALAGGDPNAATSERVPSPVEQDAMQALGLDDARVVPVALDGRIGGQVDEQATLRLDLGTGALDVALTPRSVLTRDFRLLEDVGLGLQRQVAYEAPATFRGEVSGAQTGSAAITWLEDGAWGRIQLDDGVSWWIQPAVDMVPGVDDARLHVLYRGDDVIEIGARCGTDDLPHAGHVGGFSSKPADPPTSNASAGSDPPFIAELACDADFEYYQDYGSSSTSVMNRITSVINTMNLQYESEVGIEHQITTILVRTTSNDPYTSTNANTLLNEFQDEWNDNQGGIQRDVAQLFTGKNIQGGTIGIAFLSTICNLSTAYGVVESDFSGSFACVTDLSAHELGHNWSADHCTCNNFTMNPFITCANQFTPNDTIPAIVGFRDNRQCLSGGPDPFAKFTGFPRSGDAPLAVDFTDTSTGTGLTSWSWDFGDGNTSTQQSPTHVYTVPGTYDVSLTVTGSLGTYTRTSSDFVTVSDPFLATCTDRPGDGSNPDIYDCVTTPILGTNWITSVDGGSIGASGLSVQFGYALPAPFPIPSSFGQILIDPTSGFFFSSFSAVIGGTASHSIPIPNDTSLEMLPVYTQVFLNGVGQLTNGIDVELGK